MSNNRGMLPLLQIFPWLFSVTYDAFFIKEIKQIFIHNNPFHINKDEKVHRYTVRGGKMYFFGANWDKFALFSANLAS